VGLISLGCAKNLVDGEILLGELLRAGIEITNDPAQADALIVNTCSFIDSAQEESVDAILECATERDARNPRQALLVAGCLPQRFREDLPKLLPEVDAFLGLDEVTRIPELVHRALTRRASRAGTAPKAEARPGSALRARARLRALPQRVKGDEPSSQTPHPPASPAPALVEIDPRPTFIPDYATPRFRLTPRHFAYVKIAEGCNHPCSFCIIPRIRGSHRSRPPGDIVREARQLLAEGVKELNLVSQDSTYYGLDLRPTRTGSIASPDRFTAVSRALPADVPTLSRLLHELNALPGDFWIRLLYTHPAHWTGGLIRTIAELPKVARYVDLPLQHIHDTMLERMRRETTRQHIVNLIAQLRAGIPGLVLRTTFIVGFPGETERCFETLLEFIRETRFERLGVFAYSPEAGTRAARMDNQVPDAVKQRRREQAMATQLEVARGVAQSFVGRTLKVLVEGIAQGERLPEAHRRSWEHGQMRDSKEAARGLRRLHSTARSEADAPDIDGRVYVRGGLAVGEFAQVRIVGHTDYDLLAEPTPADDPGRKRVGKRSAGR
jgi:ribosomal protein S12 methylthiotransferase